MSNAGKVMMAARSRAVDMNLTYRGASSYSSFSYPTLTMGTMSIGTAPSAGYDRYVIVVFNLPNGASGTDVTLSAMKVGGNAVSWGNYIAQHYVTIDETQAIGIYGPINTGTTASLSIQLSASVGSLNTYAKAHYYTIEIPQAATFSTTPDAYDTAQSGTDITASITATAKAAVVGTYNRCNGSSTSETTTMTEDNNIDLGGGEECAALSEEPTSDGTISINCVSADTPQMISLAAWSATL